MVNADQTQNMCGHTINLIEGLPRQLDLLSLPKSACLGVLGIPGLSAYIALKHVCKAKAGETLVISSAAGQIGHLSGQIAKIMGLKVIGYTRDADKASWIKTELGFDWAFNHKTQDVRQTLRIATASKKDELSEPQQGINQGPGVDIFLDAVGGVFHSTVVDHMKTWW